MDRHWPAALLLLTAAAPAMGQNLTFPKERVYAPRPIAGHGFAWRDIEVAHGWMAVYSDRERNPRDPIFGDRGAVHMYRRIAGTWRFHQTLYAIEPPISSGLGYAMTFGPEGEFFIGNPVDNLGVPDAEGLVHRYEFNGCEWVFRERIQVPSLGQSSFGASMDYSCGRLYVGAPGYSPPNSMFNGGVVVMEKLAGQWTVSDVVRRREGGILTNYIGTVVRADGDTLVASSYLYDNLVTFELKQGQWVQRNTIIRPYGIHSTLSSFGHAFDVEGDTLVVGDPFLDRPGLRGLAIVYRRDSNRQWTAVQVLQDAAIPYNHFGVAISINGNQLAVGASLDIRPNEAGRGRVYLYERPTAEQDFVLVGTLVGDDDPGQQPEPDHLFGGSVTLTDGSLLVGDNFYHDAHGERRGVVHSFDFPLGTHVCEPLTPNTPAFSVTGALVSWDGYVTGRLEGAAPGSIFAVVAARTYDDTVVGSIGCLAGRPVALHVAPSVVGAQGQATVPIDIGRAFAGSGAQVVLQAVGRGPLGAFATSAVQIGSEP